MAPPLLHLQNIELTFGGTPLLTNTEMAVMPRDRLCIVGRNGSGKSTFLKIAAGLVTADRGTRFVQPGTRMRYLKQEPSLEGFETIRDFAIHGMEEHDDAYQADALLDALKIDGKRAPTNLSGGEIRRAAIAQALAPSPDILMLDEPTNHLDLPTIEWLESELGSTNSAIVLISHDRAFLSKLSRETVWIDRGETRRIPKGFDNFESWRDQFLEEEAETIHKMKQKIVMEEDWLRYGVTARRKRNQKRLRDLHQLRADHASRKRSANRGEIVMDAQTGEQSGKRVMEAVEVNKAFDSRPIIQDLNLKVNRGDRLGIAGPNGAGKTTLIKLITGAIEPDSGSIKLGTNLEIATLDQQRDALKPEWTLKNALTRGDGDQVQIGTQSKHVMSYMKDFLFRPEQANTPIHALSGGERGRLMLARALSIPSNFMVLDEPTNDLDLETLDLLQEMLTAYEGTVILVSHDRDFLDRVCTGLLTFEGDAKWQLYPGGYSDMVSQRGSGVRHLDEAPKAAKAKTAAKTAPTPTEKKKRKLSFKEEQLLKTLPEQIDKITRDIDKITARLADPSIYDGDPGVVTDLTEKLEKRQTLLAQAEDKWLELEELKEALSNG